MITESYHEWPFHPPEQRSLEENERWWTRAYLSGVADDQLRGSPHWTLITGEAGSGKSVALRAWMRDESRRSFIVPYPPNLWPGAPGAWFRDQPGHLPQMVAAVGRAAHAHLESHPEDAAVRPLQREFLRWLLEKMGGARMFRRLADGLPEELREAYLATPREPELFRTFDDPQDVHGLIDELGRLAQGLGYQRVVFVVDLPGESGAEHSAGVAELFGWLDIAHHPRLAVVVAAPDIVVSEGQVIGRARGRASVVRARWTEAECRAIAEGHLCLALDRPEGGVRLEELATAEVLDRAGRAIAAEYGRPTPGGWVALAETLLYLTAGSPTPLPRPVASADAALAMWFARHLKLRVDLRLRGVWRGPRLIRLDEQPFRFLCLLHQRRGAPVNWDDDELRTLALSKNNVHSLAARARKAIEPVKAAPVYLLSGRGEGGYWLENCLEASRTPKSDNTVTG